MPTSLAAKPEAAGDAMMETVPSVGPAVTFSHVDINSTAYRSAEWNSFPIGSLGDEPDEHAEEPGAQLHEQCGDG